MLDSRPANVDSSATAPLTASVDDAAAVVFAALAIASAVLMVLVLLGQFAVLPWPIGLLILGVTVGGTVRQWGWAPLVVLVLVALVFWPSREHPFGVIRGFAPALGFGDLLVAGLLVCYVSCHYRQSVLRTPQGDRRTLSEVAAGLAAAWRAKQQADSAQANFGQFLSDLAASSHFIRGILAAVLAVVAALLWPLLAANIWRLWQSASHNEILQTLDVHFHWRVPIAIFWTVGITFALARTAHFYVRWRSADPLEAELELNDLVWRELRREFDAIGRRLGKL